MALKRKKKPPKAPKKPVPEGMSRHEFAAFCKVARSSIIQAVHEGRITITNGKIDPHEPTNVYFREKALGRKGLIGPIAQNDGNLDPDGENAQGNSGKVGQSGGVVQKMPLKQRADIAKIKQQIIALELRNKQMRNELISADLIHRHFSMWYSIETTELLPLGDRIASELVSLVRSNYDDRAAAVIVGQKINTECVKVLERIDSLIKEFVKSIPVEDEQEN